MLNVDELKYCMKRTLYSLGISLLLCLAACENGEAPVLGAIIIDKVTTETITCHVEVVASNIVDYGFYYGTSRSSVSNNKSKKEAGTYDASTIHGEIVGLTPNKDYYIKAYGMNEFGKGETEVVKVKTLPLTPGEDDNNFPDFK